MGFSTAKIDLIFFSKPGWYVLNSDNKTDALKANIPLFQKKLPALMNFLAVARSGFSTNRLIIKAPWAAFFPPSTYP